MTHRQDRKYFYISLSLHLAIVLMVVLGVDFTSEMPVVENTNQNDVISAVVLGDTAKSKIIPQKITPPPPPPPVKEEPKPEPKKIEAAAKPEPVKKDVIALKAADKKKKAAEKALAEKMKRELLAKDLLADIKKIEKQKKLTDKQTQTKFQKLLKEQAEKSLRQQLLNEEIKVQGKEARYSHGVVDKYRALILQAISEHWLIPPQSKKNIYSELMIRLAPGGMVLDVQITKSSGDPALDSSVRAAVLKASPLPVPAKSDDFEPFRQFVLKVKPENVLPT